MLLGAHAEAVTVGGARAPVAMVLSSSQTNTLVAVFELVFIDGMQKN